MEKTGDKIIALLDELNYKKVIINNTPVYNFEEKYLKVTFINKLEYADSFEEANKNLYEDGDLYPISMNEDELIFRLRGEIINS